MLEAGRNEGRSAVDVFFLFGLDQPGCSCTLYLSDKRATRAKQSYPNEPTDALNTATANLRVPRVPHKRQHKDSSTSQTPGRAQTHRSDAAKCGRYFRDETWTPTVP